MHGGGVAAAPAEAGAGSFPFFFSLHVPPAHLRCPCFSGLGPCTAAAAADATRLAQSLSLAALKAVLAGHGFTASRPGATRAEILREVAAELCGDARDDAEKVGWAAAAEVPKRLGASASAPSPAKKARQAAKKTGAKAAAVDAVVVSDSDDSEDSEYDPDA